MNECKDLVYVLEISKGVYGEEWKKVSKDTLNKVAKIQNILKNKVQKGEEFTDKDVRDVLLIKSQIPKSSRRIFQYLLGRNKPQVLLSLFNEENFKDLVRTTVIDKSIGFKEIPYYFEQITSKVKGIGRITLSAWISILRPDMFIPLGIIPSNLYAHVECPTLDESNVSEYYRIIQKSAKMAGISNLIEVAFYLIYFKNEIYPNLYVEIASKFISSAHVGKYLFFGYTGPLWEIEERRQTIPQPEDIVLHFLDNDFIGISRITQVRGLSKSRFENGHAYTEGIKLAEDGSIWNTSKTSIIKQLENFRLLSPTHKDIVDDLMNSNEYVVFIAELEPYTRSTQDILKRLIATGKLNIKSETLFNTRGIEIRKIKEKHKVYEMIMRMDKSPMLPDLTLTRYYLSMDYLYPPHLVSQFYTALKTKGFVILSGLTGTGKTKIAQELAELLDGSKNNLLFLSVRPDWRDSKPLLGYYNPLTGEYHKTPLLEFILRAKEDYEQNREKAMPYFIILDEMNLAHVEYYFADFLSVLESGRDDDGFTRESIKLHDNDAVETFQGIPRELKLPPNLYIVGTVNMDETTYSFSPKVLDRAFVVEFHDVELEEYPPERINLSEEEVEKLRNAVLDDLRGEKGKFLARSKEEINKAVRELKDTEYWRVLVELNKALEPYDMHFGYRIVDEIALFFINAKESWKVGIIEFENNNNENKVNNEIFDLALLMKVLPKFHGNREKLEEPLKAVLKLCLSESAGIDVQELRKENVIELLKNWEKEKENFRFKHTARKVLRMLRQLYEIGFASFS